MSVGVGDEVPTASAKRLRKLSHTGTGGDAGGGDEGGTGGGGEGERTSLPHVRHGVK